MIESQYTDYSNFPCLFELADYNKLQLTKCRRADDTLYNLIKFDNIPNVIISKVNNEDLGIFNNHRFKIDNIDTFTITIKDYFNKLVKLIFQAFKNIFSLGMPPQPSVLKACQLVSHIQFMSGIEWTKGLNMSVSRAVVIFHRSIL